METLASRPLDEAAGHAEQLRSFDVLASVDKLRFDLQWFGHILPETRQRVIDEEVSYLAEGADRASRTSFVFARQDGDLQYFQQGSWRPYGAMLVTGLKVARQEAAQDYRRQFLVEWAERDIDYGYKMRQLRPGEQLIWTNSFPHALAERYGTAFLDSCGLQSERGMGFIYRAYCRPDGHVVLESQTVDGSDAEALAAVNGAAARSPRVTLDELVTVYDETVSRKYGGHFYAGRRQAAPGENAWQVLRQHQDLINYLVGGLEKLAASALPRHELARTTKKHLYGVWATLKARLDSGRQPSATYQSRGVPQWLLHARLAREVAHNFREFAAVGRVLVGCGGSIQVLAGEADILAADAADVHSAIFGGEKMDKYGSLRFKCPKGHSNTRPRGRLIEKCQVCRMSVRC